MTRFASPGFACLPLEACTDGNEVLGFIAYTGATRPAALPATLPALAVPMAPLQPGRPVALVLRGGMSSAGRHGRVSFRHDGEHLFGVIELDEASVSLGGEHATPLQQLAEAAYRDLFGTLDAQDYPHLLRVWNYFGDINLNSHGLERYRQFNIGRQHAFAACARAFTGEVPAACALGSSAGPLQIAFLAGRRAVRPVENPRQVSAYHYPAEYGPRSPTFSRAALAGTPETPLLLVSGTASIVGHRSLHPGDVKAQTRESLANIAAVVTEAGRLAGGAVQPLDALFYTVYVRHAGDLAAVQTEFASILPGARAIFVQADVCRAELLVEIEASGGHPLEFTP